MAAPEADPELLAAMANLSAFHREHEKFYGSAPRGDVEVLDALDFTPAALRVDLSGDRLSSQRVASAAEMISHAADLASDSSGARARQRAALAGLPLEGPPAPGRDVAGR
jgi:hypothetical protein